MPEHTSSLKSLEIRRALLAAEADIQRQQVLQEWSDFKASFHEIGGALKSARTAFSFASVAASALSAVRRLSFRRGGVVSKVLAGAGLASALWYAIRSRAR